MTINMWSSVFKAKVSYDPEFNFLSVRREGIKTSYSLNFGSVTIDFFKNTPVGIEFAEAQEVLEKLLRASKLGRESLAKVTNGSFAFRTSKSDITIVFGLMLANEQKLQATYVLPLVNKDEVKITA